MLVIYIKQILGSDPQPPWLGLAWQVYGEDHRLATFRHWPFQEGCACTSERMAAAGFVHCPTENEPDLVECFFSFKELEGWEPDDDDPAEEHRKLFRLGVPSCLSRSG